MIRWIVPILIVSLLAVPVETNAAEDGERLTRLERLQMRLERRRQARLGITPNTDKPADTKTVTRVRRPSPRGSRIADRRNARLQAATLQQRRLARANRRRLNNRPVTTVTKPTSDTSALLLTLNEERERNGLSALRWHHVLTKAAQAHAEDMVNRDYFDAVGPDGITVKQRALDSNYVDVDPDTCNCKSWSYSISSMFARGANDPDRLLGLWLDSDSITEALLNSGFRDIGIGHKGDTWVVAVGAVDVVPRESFTDRQIADFADEVLRLTNEERARVGVGPLTRNSELDKAALAHAIDMRARNYFAHQSPEGEGVTQRVKKTSYLGGARGYSVGENLAKGQETPAAVVQGWIESQGHYENLINSSFTELGIGIDPLQYWVQVFGTRQY